MDELKTELIYVVFFTAMESADDGWDPVKLA